MNAGFEAAAGHMRVLIRLYPRAWRARYGDELATLLSEEKPSLRLAVDLIAGAIDARLNPQLPSGDGAGGRAHGDTAMAKTRAFCQPSEIPTSEHLKSAVTLLGGTVVLAAGAIALKAMFGDSLFVEALNTSVFPLVLVFAMRGTYFRMYSRAARTVMTGTLALAVFLISLIATFLARLT